MGFGDKLKDLRKQAQEAVVEHKEQIQNAVEVAGAAANEKTHGKYASKIAKFGEKATSAVDKFGTDDENAAPGDIPARDPASAPGDVPASDAASAPESVPTTPAPPAFADAAPAAAAAPPATSHDDDGFPKFDE